MASNIRERLSFWGCLRPRHHQESRVMEELPMDIWDLLDDFIDGSVTPRDSLTRRSGQFRHPSGLQPPHAVDVSAVMRKCRKQVYKSGKRKGKDKGRGSQTECPVCLESFISKDQLLILPCHHCFHRNCITPWIKSQHACCPCCRANILGGPKKGGKKSSVSVSTTLTATPPLPPPLIDVTSSRIQNGRSNTHHARSWSSGIGTIIRRVRVHRGLLRCNHTTEGQDVWEGLHEYITTALAEMDLELNRLLR